MNELDKDTREVFRKGETVRQFVDSDGWRLAKDLLLSKLKTIDSISTVVIDGRNQTDVIRELESRSGAKALIEEWISEVEGLAEQATDHKQIFETDYIRQS